MRFATGWHAARERRSRRRAGRHHAVNEDCHSALDGAPPLFVVADGVGGGAMASRASRELVARLHACARASARATQTRVRSAVLDADRAIARTHREPHRRVGRRDGGAVRREPARRCRSGWSRGSAIAASTGVRRARHGDAAQLLTVDDTYRHLSEAAAARRLARRSGAHGRQRRGRRAECPPRRARPRRHAGAVQRRRPQARRCRATSPAAPRPAPLRRCAR